MKPANNHLVYLAFIISALTACSGGMQIAKDKIQNDGQLLFNGHVKPDINCYHCHNGDATGTWRGDDLKNAKGLSKEKILTAINNGPGMFMPAYKDTLTEEQKNQLADWIASLHTVQAKE